MPINNMIRFGQKIALLTLLLSIVFLFCPLAKGVLAGPTANQVSVADMAGRKIIVPKAVKRIVALGPGALRFIVYFNAFDRVVGVERLEKTPSPGRLYSLTFDERRLKELPVVGEGGPGRLPDFEGLVSVRPDVVFLMAEDASPAELIQKKTGIPVVFMRSGPLGSLKQETVVAAIRLMGKVLGEEGRAEDLVRIFNDVQADLNRRTANIPEAERPLVYVGAIAFKGMHGITSTEPHYLPLSWVNGRNAANSLPVSGHAFIDLEKLLAWDPDVIFVDSSGLPIMETEYRRRPELFGRLKAVQDSRVFTTLPYNHYNTNVEIAVANAYFIGKTLYPERFKDIDPRRKFDDISIEFIGIPAYRHIEREFHGFKALIFEKDGIHAK